jgi:hypothetical protein
VRALSSLRLGISLALSVGLLALAPGAQAHVAAVPTLYVNFFGNQTIAVTLADGTPVGSTTGSSPTVIPAGYYALVFSGPGGCSALPNFKLNGPGTSIVTSMSEGAVLKATQSANFTPTSTYTWIDDAFPNVVHTFSTSSDVISVPPPVTTTTTTSSPPKGKAVVSQDVVGSEVVPFRGTLTGGVSASGMLALAYNGKSVGSLKAGRYRIAVTDGSSTKGFVLQKAGHKAIAVTGATFMGKRAASMNLTAGKWLFAPGPGKTAYTVVVK